MAPKEGIGRDQRKHWERTGSCLQKRGLGLSFSRKSLCLGVPSPFFPGILLFRKQSTTRGKQPVFEKIDG